MTIQTTAHCKALKDLIEIMAIASALGFVADCIWIVVELHDVGITAIKLVIMTFLHVALFMQTYALYKFHKGLVLQLMANMKTEKKAAILTKARIARRKATANSKRSVK